MSGPGALVSGEFVAGAGVPIGGAVKSVCAAQDGADSAQLRWVGVVGLGEVGVAGGFVDGQLGGESDVVSGDVVSAPAAWAAAGVVGWGAGGVSVRVDASTTPGVQSAVELAARVRQQRRAWGPRVHTDLGQRVWVQWCPIEWSDGESVAKYLVGPAGNEREVMGGGLMVFGSRVENSGLVWDAEWSEVGTVAVGDGLVMVEGGAVMREDGGGAIVQGVLGPTGPVGPDGGGNGGSGTAVSGVRAVVFGNVTGGVIAWTVVESRDDAEAVAHNGVPSGQVRTGVAGSGDVIELGLGARVRLAHGLDGLSGSAVGVVSGVVASALLDLGVGRHEVRVAGVDGAGNVGDWSDVRVVEIVPRPGAVVPVVDVMEIAGEPAFVRVRADELALSADESPVASVAVYSNWNAAAGALAPWVNEAAPVAVLTQRNSAGRWGEWTLPVTAITDPFAVGQLMGFVRGRDADGVERDELQMWSVAIPPRAEDRGVVLPDVLGLVLYAAAGGRVRAMWVVEDLRDASGFEVALGDSEAAARALLNNASGDPSLRAELSAALGVDSNGVVGFVWEPATLLGTLGAGWSEAWVAVRAVLVETELNQLNQIVEVRRVRGDVAVAHTVLDEEPPAAVEWVIGGPQ
jgi:hypothetical protein